jgi:RND family efflux transporter MFP subunit
MHGFGGSGRSSGGESRHRAPFPNAFALVIWICVPLLACSEANTEDVAVTADTKPVEIETLRPQSFTSWVHVSGLVEAEARMDLSFRVDGTIERYHVEEGDYVDTNAVIAELDARDYERNVNLARAALESAEARATEAQRELARQERLVAARTSSTQEHEAAGSAALVTRSEVRQNKLQLEAAEAALEDCQLRAPVAGYIEHRLLEKHEFASLQRPVVVLTQLEHVKVRSSVADRLLASLEKGAEATILSGAWPGREFKGTVIRIALAADPKTHTLPVELRVANPDLALRPAMVVDVALKSGASDPLLTVPLKAVVRDGGLQALCFVVSDTQSSDGAQLRVESRPVVLGRLWGDRIAIDAGLSAGDRVIVKGQHFVRSGDAVHVIGPAGQRTSPAARMRLGGGP